MDEHIGWPLVLVDWGVDGVQLYMSPGTGLRWEWGSWGARGVHSGALGVPYPGELHRWCGLDVVGAWGTDVRIGPSEWDDLGLSASGLVGSVGVVVGGPRGNGPVASIVVRCVGLRA